MDYTSLVVKFNSGERLSDTELITLNHYSLELVTALHGKGMIVYCLYQQALVINNRTIDIIKARGLL